MQINHLPRNGGPHPHIQTSYQTDQTMTQGRTHCRTDGWNGQRRMPSPRVSSCGGDAQATRAHRKCGLAAVANVDPSGTIGPCGLATVARMREYRLRYADLVQRRSPALGGKRTCQRRGLDALQAGWHNVFTRIPDAPMSLPARAIKGNRCRGSKLIARMGRRHAIPVRCNSSET